MKISKKELKRVAKMCLLSFSDGEYEQLKLSIEHSLEPKVIFESPDYNQAVPLPHPPQTKCQSS